MEYENHSYEESRQDVSQNPHQAVFMWGLQRQTLALLLYWLLSQAFIVMVTIQYQLQVVSNSRLQGQELSSLSK